jgi:hypothetical protein
VERPQWQADSHVEGARGRGSSGGAQRRRLASRHRRRLGSGHDLADGDRRASAVLPTPYEEPPSLLADPEQAPRSASEAAGGAISDDNGQVLFTDPWDEVGKLYEVGKPKPVGLLRGTKTGITSAHFNSDGSLLATHGGDGDQVWDVASRQSLISLPDSPTLTNVAFGRDGRTIVSLSSFPDPSRTSDRLTFPCDVCGGFSSLLALAQRRVSRKLTDAERAQFLH